MNWIRLATAYVNLAAIGRFEWQAGLEQGEIIWLSGDAPMVVEGQECWELAHAIEKMDCHDAVIPVRALRPETDFTKTLQVINCESESFHGIPEED